MATPLKISFSTASDKGRKSINQDACAVSIPKEPYLTTKGIALVLADGISSSEVSQEASQTAVSGFLTDYFDTPESWSVKHSATIVIKALNAWLYGQSRQSIHRYNPDKGYVCTFTAIILKGDEAHIFHIGDARVYYVHHGEIQQITEDHRKIISAKKSYLSRALGVNDSVEIDYHRIAYTTGDSFLLVTDGIYEFLPEKTLQTQFQHNQPETVAQRLLDQAYQEGSDDNLSAIFCHIQAAPKRDEKARLEDLTLLPFPPHIQPRMTFDGYEVLREIHISHRSQVYLVKDSDNARQMVLKLPSSEMRQNTAQLERFQLEEWVARRIHSPHVLKACEQTRKRHYLYSVSEYIEGITLRQWMLDHPSPDIEQVRKIIEQIAKGLQAFHRLEMLHQDLRPENIMIDQQGTVKIIDFGAVRVAGLMEINHFILEEEILGSIQYTAPEYFLGELGTEKSDLFSLGVIAYEMLSGRLPYGAEVARSQTRMQQKRLNYVSVIDEDKAIPIWVDGAIQKAVQIFPEKRYDEITEFIYDLRHPNPKLISQERPPLLERNPTRFWQGVSFLLSLIIIVLLLKLNS